MSKPSNVATLPHALEKAQSAQEKLESGARDLFVVNEVLKQEIPESVKTEGEVAAALQRSEAVQSNMEVVVGDLDDVSKALAAEVARRKAAEQTLRETKADLADTKAQLADANDPT